MQSNRFLHFIARNVAWVALRWLYGEEFRVWGGPREAIVMLSVSKEVLHARLSGRPIAEYPQLFPPIITLYPGRTQKLEESQ